RSPGCTANRLYGWSRTGSHPEDSSRRTMDTHRKTRVCLANLKQLNSAAARLIMPDDSLHPGPRFRSVIRRPFIEDGRHSLTVESQPESVVLRKLGNLPFSLLIV